MVRATALFRCCPVQCVFSLASVDQVDLNDMHPVTLRKSSSRRRCTKSNTKVIKSRIDWDKHEPRMWSRASALSNEELAKFTMDEDLVEVRSGHSSNADYGHRYLRQDQDPCYQ